MPSTQQNGSNLDAPAPNDAPYTTAAHTDSTNDPDSEQSFTPSNPPLGSLGKLPLEVRNLIYHRLMVTEKMIQDAYKLVGTKKVVMEADCPRIKGLGVTILRASRAIYQEGLPIRYGHNSFCFRKPSHLEIFAHEELPRNGFKTVFGLETQKYGRLSLVRNVGLNIGVGHKCRRAKLDRKAIWNTWYRFFNSDSPFEPLGFPLLKSLRLDFAEWRLGQFEIDGIRVEIIEAIIRKLRVSDGLAELMIIGMKQEQNLFDLKHGLVKTGGQFRGFEEAGGEYVEVTQDLSAGLRWLAIDQHVHQDDTPNLQT